MQGQYVFVKYDNIGLPMCVADSVAEMAAILGVSRQAIDRSIKTKGGIYKKVWIDYEDEE